MSNNSSPVYSTDSGRICPECHQHADSCIWRSKTKVYPEASCISISREVKGRKGKIVTLIKGVGGSENRLKDVAATLKKTIGCGGTVSGDTILIQGDHRKKILKVFTRQGKKAKING